MKQDDKDMLMVLGIMGAIVLAGGVGTAVLVAHKNPTFENAAVGFIGGISYNGGRYIHFVNQR